MVTVQTPSKFDVFFAAKRNFYDAKQCFFAKNPGFTAKIQSSALWNEIFAGYSLR